MLEVVGAGFSRTGTSSLKEALEILGFGPCYHMHEVFLKPEHVPVWASASTKAPDWRQLFHGYASAVDAPTCHFWEQIHTAFQGSKVILTERDHDDWYDSFYATVYQVLRDPSLTTPSERAVIEMVKKLELKTIFANQFEDKAYAIDVYKAHNEHVKNTLFPKDLLVFNVSKGWKPLCKFLKVDVPNEAFPNKNSRPQFQDRAGI